MIIANMNPIVHIRLRFTIFFPSLFYTKIGEFTKKGGGGDYLLALDAKIIIAAEMNAITPISHIHIGTLSIT